MAESFVDETGRRPGELTTRESRLRAAFLNEIDRIPGGDDGKEEREHLRVAEVQLKHPGRHDGENSGNGSVEEVPPFGDQLPAQCLHKIEQRFT